MADPILDGMDPITGQPRVPALPVITAPLPATKVKHKKAYTCSIPIASIHRKDGKRITFISGFHETDLLHDQEFLDAEIEAGHPHLAHATVQEVDAAHMRMDPRATIEAKVRAEMEPKLRAELEAKIKKELAGEGDNLVDDRQETLNLDATKLAGSDAVAVGLARLKAGKDGGNVVKTDNATIIMQPGGARLTPVSTADLGGGAKDSNSIP